MADEKSPKPLPVDPDDDAPPEEWAARHIMRNAGAVPEWVDLRKDIDDRLAVLRRRNAAHHQWLHDRTRLLAELPADRIIDAVK
ncbi:MAG TPA: DnaJ family domain-containing protein, partial [Methylomirabilota bacterium]|nr:DnaJ family domain-containing protein [Methylomirabilota bacterium]